MNDVNILQHFSLRTSEKVNIKNEKITFQGIDIECNIINYQDKKYAIPRKYNSFIVEISGYEGIILIDYEDKGLYTFLDVDRKNLIVVKFIDNQIISRNVYKQRMVETSVDVSRENFKTIISPYRFTSSSEKIYIYDDYTFLYIIDKDKIVNFTNRKVSKLSSESIIIDEFDIKKVIKIDCSQDVTSNVWVSFLVFIVFIIIALILSLTNK